MRRGRQLDYARSYGVDLAAKLDIDVTTKIVKIDSALRPERLLAVIEEAGFHPTVSA